MTGPASGPAPRRHAVRCIEDNPVNAALLGEMLAARPHLVLQHAALPDIGLQMAPAAPPDLILLDIHLSGIDGFKVLRRLRLAAATRHTPVLALSASAMPSDVERGLAAGFAHDLAKPLDKRRQMAVLDGLLPPP